MQFEIYEAKCQLSEHLKHQLPEQTPRFYWSTFKLDSVKEKVVHSVITQRLIDYFIHVISYSLSNQFSCTIEMIVVVAEAAGKHSDTAREMWKLLISQRLGGPSPPVWPKLRPDFITASSQLPPGRHLCFVNGAAVTPRHQRKPVTVETDGTSLAEAPFIFWIPDCIPHGSVQGRRSHLLSVLLFDPRHDKVFVWPQHDMAAVTQHGVWSTPFKSQVPVKLERRVTGQIVLQNTQPYTAFLRATSLGEGTKWALKMIPAEISAS